MLGAGLGGFFDGILLHQILQWHHMLTSEGDHPATTVEGLETNTLWDGLFHATTWLLVLAGLLLLWRALRRGSARSGRRLLGFVLAGWGAFNVVEGLVNHQLLTIHHVNPQSSVVFWDAAFLFLGLLLLAGGLALARGSPEAPAAGT